MPGWWRVAVPSEATELEIPGNGGSRRDAVDRLRSLDRGALVALRDARPASWLRTRSFIASAGLRLEKEFVAIPGFDSPGFLVEDNRLAFRHFFTRVLYVPTGDWRGVVGAGLAARLAAGWLGWRIAAALAPARIVIARKV